MRFEKITLECESLDATERIGRRLGAVLARGHFIGLIGPLGSGKTTLVKAIAAGAGVGDPRSVNSPTFVIVNEYEGGASNNPLRIYHLDAYRLRHSDDLAALGFDEMCAQGAVLLEWADRVAEALPADRLTIVLEPLGETYRRLKCEAQGSSAVSILEAMAASR